MQGTRLPNPRIRKPDIKYQISDIRYMYQVSSACTIHANILAIPIASFVLAVELVHQNLAIAANKAMVLVGPFGFVALVCLEIIFHTQKQEIYFVVDEELNSGCVLIVSWTCSKIMDLVQHAEDDDDHHGHRETTRKTTATAEGDDRRNGPDGGQGPRQTKTQDVICMLRP